MEFQVLTDNLHRFLCLFILFNILVTSHVRSSRVGDVVDINELFHTNFGEFFRISDPWDPWYTCPSTDDDQPALFYRYGQAYVLQNYSETANMHVNGDEKALDIFSQPNLTEKSWTGAAISSHDQFKFLYGEYEWIARIAASRNLLSVFRLTESVCHRNADASTAIKTERLERPAVQLAVEWMGTGKPTSLNATIFYPSKLFLLRHPSPDWSDSPHTGWISSIPSCQVCQHDLSRAFHSYKLRWTKNEVTWLINDTVVYRLRDVRKIPQAALFLSISVVRGENIAEMTPAILAIQSVAVRNIAEGNATNQATYNHLNETTLRNISNLSHSRWLILEGLTSDSINVGNGRDRPIYDPLCVREKNGMLQLLVGQTTTSANEQFYNTARIDGTTSFLYGDIEWRARVMNPSIGATYWLELIQNPCTEIASDSERSTSFQCDSSLGPSINFYFHKLSVEGRYYFSVEKKLVYQIGQPAYQYQLSDGLRSIHDFHRFRIRWRDSSITWYIDDEDIGSITDPSILPNSSMFVSMQTRVNQAPLWPAAVKDHSAFLVPSMEIAYLKYTTNTTAVPPPPTTTTAHTILTTTTMMSWERVTAIAVSLIIAVMVCCVLFFGIRRFRALRRTSMNTNLLPMLLRTIPASERHTYARYIRFMEVSRNEVDISSEVLGRGEFGVVLKGSARRLPTVVRGPTDVAVKTLSNSTDRTKFYEEFLIMTKTGRHVNVTNLLGVVWEVGAQCLLLEYCRYGSLRSYLQSYGAENTNHHVDSYGSLLPCACINRNDVVKPDQNAEGDGLCTNDLLKFSHQISRGMEYLTSRSIIHRDLAARNVLVSDHRILKISDFGLAKHGQQDYTASNMSAALPVLWMSPEAILNGTFSHKSDVWSFGVVLWEIFSLGQQPFSTVDVIKFPSGSFASWLLAGHQMEMPPGTPTDIRKIMQNCWNIEPDELPSFSDLVTIANDIISTQSRSAGLTYSPLLDRVCELPLPYQELLEQEAERITNLQTDA